MLALWVQHPVLVTIKKRSLTRGLEWAEVWGKVGFQSQQEWGTERSGTDFWCEQGDTQHFFLSAVAIPRRMRRKGEHLHEYRIPAGGQGFLVTLWTSHARCTNQPCLLYTGRR